MARMSYRKGGAPNGRRPGTHAGWESRPPRVDTALHLGLVHAIARTFVDRPGLDLDERVSLGVQALEKAARIYDPERALKFSTLAGPWIWQAIRRAYEREGYESSATVAADRSRRRIHLSQARGLGVRPIDLPARDRLREVDDADEAEHLWRRVDALGPRPAEIVRRWAHGERLAAIARDLGVSRERVRQIQRKAIRRLREAA